jgi:F like protein
MNPNKLQRLLELESQTFIIPRIGRANIERTLTNKELQKIENEYVVRFKIIFTKIVTEYKNKEYLLHEARQKYGGSIHTLIKSMVSRVYFLGMTYVGKAINKPYLITIEQVDEQNIIEQTKQAEDMFWRLITKYLQVIKNRTLVFKTAAAAEEPEEDNLLLSVLTNVNLILSTIATTVLALATVAKTKQVQELQFQTLDGRSGKESIQEQRQVIVFVTSKDERVCPICTPLNGREWDIDSPYIQIPRVHTHHRCRCRLLLKINGNTISK